MVQLGILKLLLLLLVASICNATCPLTENEIKDGTSEGEMKYEVGKSYLYKLKTETSIASYSSSEGNNSFKLEAVASLRKNDNDCEFCLSLRQVKITTKSGEVQDINDKGGDLVFFYHNFRLHQKLLHEKKTENELTANIKRAIISMLQTSTKDTEMLETDISGACNTTYKTNGTEIAKTKTKCVSLSTSLPSSLSIFDQLSNAALSNPIIFWQHKCNHKLQNGIVENAECQEYNPFGMSYTSSRTTLELVEVKNEASDINSCKADRTQFSASFMPYYNKPEEQNDLATAINKLLTDIGQDINAGVADPDNLQDNLSTLRHLVGLVRNSAVFESVDQKIEELKKVFEKNGLSDTILHLFEKEPTYSTLKHLSKKLEDGTVHINDEFISNLIRNFPYLKYFGAETYSTAERLAKVLVTVESKSLQIRLISFFVNHLVGLNSVCYDIDACSDSEIFKKALEVVETEINKLSPILQSEVAGHVFSEVHNNFSVLCSGSDTDFTSRVDALYCLRNSFRRTPCDATGKAKVISVLQDSKLSSDLRIQAYLATMYCYNDKNLNIVENLFKSENTDSDLLGFIATHFENHANDVPPEFREALQPLINNFKKQLPPGRKLSKNFFISFGDKKKISIDINIIFNNSSFVPSGIEGSLKYMLGNGKPRPLFAFGLFADKLEPLIQKYMQNSQNEIEDGEGLIYLRNHRGNIYFRKFSLKELENNVKEFLRKLQDNMNIDLLQLWTKAKNINYFRPFTYMQEENIIYTAGGIPVKYLSKGSGFLFSKLKAGEKVASADSSGTVNTKFAVSLTQSVSAGFEQYEIGAEIELKMHSGIDFKWLFSPTNSLNFSTRIDLPHQNLVSFGMNAKSLLTEFVNYNYIRRAVNHVFATRENACYMEVKDNLKLCTRKHEVGFYVGKVDPLLKAFNLQFLTTFEDNEKTMKISLIPVRHENDTLSIASVDLKYLIADNVHNATFGIHSPWLSSDLTVSWTDTENLKDLNVALNEKGRVHAANLHYKKIFKTAKDETLQNEYSKKGILCIWPMDAFCNYEYDILIEFSSPYFLKPIKVVEILVNQDYKENLSFKVATGGPYKAAQGVFQGKIWHTRSINEENGDRNFNTGVDWEIISRVFGSLQVNTSIVLFEGENKANLVWDTIGEYGRHGSQEKEQIAYKSGYTQLWSYFANETHKYNKHIYSHQLRSTQYPLSLFNYNLEITELEDKSIGNEIVTIRYSPNDPTKQTEIKYDFRKHSWKSIDEFHIDKMLSVSFRNQELLLLQTYAVKDKDRFVANLLWKLHLMNEYRLSVNYDAAAGKHDMKGGIKFLDKEYEIEHNQLKQTISPSSTRYKYNSKVIELPGGLEVLSLTTAMTMDSKEGSSGNIEMKLINDKQFEFDYDLKVTDKTLTTKTYIKDILEGNNVANFNKDGTTWPIKIQLNTKLLQKKLKVTGTIILSPKPDGEFTADSKLKWMHDDDPDIVVGSSDGKIIWNFRNNTNYALHSEFEIKRKGKDDLQLKIHGNPRNDANEIMQIHENPPNNVGGTVEYWILFSPEIDIKLKTPKENIFIAKCTSPLFTLAAYDREIIFNLRNEIQLQFEVNFHIGSGDPKVVIHNKNNQTMMIVLKKSAISLLPADFSLKLFGEQILDVKGELGEELFNATFTLSSDGGILPKKAYTWNFWTDVYDTYEKSDQDDNSIMGNKTRPMHRKIEMTILEDSKVKRNFTTHIKKTTIPFHANDSSTDTDQISLDLTKYEFKYTISASSDVDDDVQIQVNGLSNFSVMFESWSNFEFSQDHNILLPMRSPVPKQWNTILSYKSDNRGLLATLRQSDVLGAHFSMNAEGVHSQCTIDMPDYESGLSFNLDPKISWSYLNMEIKLKTPFRLLETGKVMVKHGKSSSTAVISYNDNVIQSYFKYDRPEDLLFSVILPVENSNRNFTLEYHAPAETQITYTDLGVVYLDAKVSCSSFPSKNCVAGLYIANSTDWTLDITYLRRNDKPGINILVFDKKEKTFNLSATAEFYVPPDQNRGLEFDGTVYSKDVVLKAEREESENPSDSQPYNEGLSIQLPLPINGIWSITLCSERTTSGEKCYDLAWKSKMIL